MLQAHTDSVIAAVGNLHLKTLTNDSTLPTFSPENALLLGFMHVINDHRLLLHMEPDHVALDRLPDLLTAAAAAPPIAASGLAAYALLSPVMATLEDLRALARGDKDCAAQMAELEAVVLADAGQALWQRALQGASDAGNGAILAQTCAATGSGAFAWRLRWLHPNLIWPRCT